MILKHFIFTGKNNILSQEKAWFCNFYVQNQENNFRIWQIEIKPQLGDIPHNKAEEIFEKIKNLKFSEIESLIVLFKDDFEIKILVLSIDKKNLQITAWANKLNQFKLVRDNKVYNLAVNNKGITGKFKKNDKFLLGSLSFFKKTPQINLEEIFANNKFKTKLENLILLFTDEEKACLGYFQSPKFNFSLPLPRFNLTQKISHLQTNRIAPNFTTYRKPILSKKRRLSLLVAIVFLVLLTISIGIGVAKRNEFKKQQAIRQLVVDISYRLEQANSLKNLNPVRAKTLLIEAKLLLEGYEQDKKLESAQLLDLQKQVLSSLSTVTGQNLVLEPDVFYDLTLLKEGFLPDKISLSENDLTMLDSLNQVMALLDIKNKSSQIIAGKDLILPSSSIGSIPAWVFVNSGNKLQIIDKATKKQIKSFQLNTVQANKLIGYGNNAYVLDTSHSQVWRFRGTSNSLLSAEEFFQNKQDLTDAIDMAVDGSVWILYKDGGVEKYTGGIKDAYYPQFALDRPLRTPRAIFTNEYCNNFYIFEPDNNRIVTISKNGEFVAEYIWEKLSQSQDFVVSEELGKILVLLGGKIYEIKI